MFSRAAAVGGRSVEGRRSSVEMMSCIPIFSNSTLDRRPSTLDPHFTPAATSAGSTTSPRCVMTWSTMPYVFASSADR